MAHILVIDDEQDICRLIEKETCVRGCGHVDSHECRL